MNFQLPNEIWYEVFQYLDGVSLLQARGVCTLWENIITNPKYITKFPPLVITGESLRIESQLERIPKWQVSGIIIKNFKCLETYDFKTCLGWTQVRRSVPYANVRSIILDHQSSIKELTIENVTFHSFMEFHDILEPCVNLEQLNLTGVTIRCGKCVRKFKRTFLPKLKNVKMRRSISAIQRVFTIMRRVQIDSDHVLPMLNRVIPVIQQVQPYQEPDLAQVIQYNPRSNQPMPAEVEELINKKRKFENN